VQVEQDADGMLLFALPDAGTAARTSG
jgi:hypothetical protein